MEDAKGYWAETDRYTAFLRTYSSTGTVPYPHHRAKDEFTYRMTVLLGGSFPATTWGHEWQAMQYVDGEPINRNGYEPSDIWHRQTAKHIVAGNADLQSAHHIISDDGVYIVDCEGRWDVMVQKGHNWRDYVSPAFDYSVIEECIGVYVQLVRDNDFVERVTHMMEVPIKQSYISIYDEYLNILEKETRV